MAETKRITQQAVTVSNFLQPELRSVYSKVFPPPGEKLENGKPAGVERRRQLCELLAPYDSLSATGQAALRSEVNTLLSGYVDPSQRFALDPDKQFMPFKVAFMDPSYAALRGIQGSSPNTPSGVDGAKTLKVGPYELQLIYNALFNQGESTTANGGLAHDFLHALKGQARLKNPSGVRAILQQVYDSKLVFANDRLHANVKLDIGDALVEQLYLVMDGSYFKGLEPYEGPESCDLTSASGAPGPTTMECY
ncbi:hypothetical protein [Pyxidicoccus xibeiensis]|uniref:hypothetical protein n=1 Tax=Pyxidicoccus xibeiensis TaxID=2906759 RepID=UPI0020A7CEA3|nr:hypothetical protein [Pyxidicoccus xibeiensis]MCP3137302.1 hypothetical protein [Pyxidicoccus xibeiensis]